jgi:hypothetical protein
MTLNSTTAAYQTRTSVRSAFPPFPPPSKNSYSDLARPDIDVMMNAYESSPTKSTQTLPETEDDLPPPKKASKSNNKAPARPPAKPLAGNPSGSGRMHSGSGAFMTQAERSKIDAKEKKAAEQDCFEFLRDLKDVSALSFSPGARADGLWFFLERGT